MAIGYASRHGVKRVAGGLTADIHAGELTCLLGANGVGKSTLMRTLSGFQPGLEGAVRLVGKDISAYTMTELARVLSVVLTERGDLQGLTARDLVGLGRSPYTGFWGTLSDEDRKRVDRAMSKTIFLSTHDLELALQLADRLWLMKGGDAGLAVGTPEDLALDGSLERFFTHRGVAFDRNAGLFRVKYPCMGQIRVTGEDRRCNMVRKALLRNGIDACKEAQTAFFIDTGREGDPFFFHSTEGETYRADTIGELVELVAASLVINH